MREGGTEDGVWVGERWICSVGVLRVEKVVFGGVWKKQQCGDNRAALGVSGSSLQCRDGFSGVFEGAGGRKRGIWAIFKYGVCGEVFRAADQSPSPQKR